MANIKREARKEFFEQLEKLKENKQEGKRHFYVVGSNKTDKTEDMKVKGNYYAADTPQDAIKQYKNDSKNNGFMNDIKANEYERKPKNENDRVKVLKVHKKLFEEKLRSVEVTYVDGTVSKTSMAAGLSDKEIKDYFKPGKKFNLGRTDDDLVAVKSVKILESLQDRISSLKEDNTKLDYKEVSNETKKEDEIIKITKKVAKKFNLTTKNVPSFEKVPSIIFSDNSVVKISQNKPLTNSRKGIAGGSTYEYKDSFKIIDDNKIVKDNIKFNNLEYVFTDYIRTVLYSLEEKNTESLQEKFDLGQGRTITKKVIKDLKKFDKIAKVVDLEDYEDLPMSRLQFDYYKQTGKDIMKIVNNTESLQDRISSLKEDTSLKTYIDNLVDDFRDYTNLVKGVRNSRDLEKLYKDIKKDMDLNLNQLKNYPISESLKEDNTMSNSSAVTTKKMLKEEIKPGKYTTKGGETITVHSVSGDKATISGDDSSKKDMDLQALMNILKESFSEGSFKKGDKLETRNGLATVISDKGSKVLVKMDKSSERPGEQLELPKSDVRLSESFSEADNLANEIQKANPKLSTKEINEIVMMIKNK